MADLHQSLVEGASATLQTKVAYGSGVTGFLVGLVTNHWLSIISAACLIYTALWNARHRKQLIKESELRQQLLAERRLDPADYEDISRGEDDRD